MERVNRIFSNPLFVAYMDKIGKAEESREFCHHDMNHFLDVARIARIMATEEGTEVSLELLYGAALLHDIGRCLEYEQGIPHEEASGQLAPAILRDCGFSKEEIETMVQAIVSHRDSSVKEQRNLSGLLYRADKASRPCFYCPAAEKCNWSNLKKNTTMFY